jgi:integrase
MKLTATAVKAARYVDKPVKLADGHGLYLHITPTANFWRYRYRIGGKAREFTIGNAEIVPLSQAREEHRQARALLLSGEDPVQSRRDEKADVKAQAQSKAVKSITVATVMAEWQNAREPEWVESHASKVRGRLKRLPDSFTSMPVMQVTADDVLTVLMTSFEAGKKETTHRLLSYLRGIFDSALADELIHRNPARHAKIKNKLGKRPVGDNFAHTTSVEVFANILRAIDLHMGKPETEVALKLLPMLFCRPTEVRAMRWDELRLDEAEWHIPVERMKGGIPHVVPLPRQAIQLITELRDRQHVKSNYVFVGRDGAFKPISDMTLGNALKRAGVPADVTVPHGFRHTASTFLNDGKVTDALGKRLLFRGDVIENQLSHKQGDIRKTYNKATYLDERAEMMQAWADWLDMLKAEVVA